MRRLARFTFLTALGAAAAGVEAAEPASQSTRSFSLAEKDLLTEGLAYDPATKSFYVGSVRQRKILRVAPDGTATPFASEKDGLFGVFGMAADAKRRRLWAATSSLPEMRGFDAAAGSKAALVVFDLGTGRVLERFDAPAGAPHVFGDVVFGPDGEAYTTDSISPVVYLAKPGKGLEPLAEGAPFRNLQGLAYDGAGKRLYLADYARGLFTLDLKTRAVSQVAVPADFAVRGIDGLYLHGRDLVAVQNGSTPQRIARLTLSADGTRVESWSALETANPEWDEPTLGVIVGDDFHYVARSQWPFYSDPSKPPKPEALREPLFLKLALGSSKKGPKR